MILYSPVDGDALTSSISLKPRHCFVLTQLGDPIPPEVVKMREAIAAQCTAAGYKAFDAAESLTGRDILLKVWRLIEATPVSVAVVHKLTKRTALMNIYYELGVAQALGKETIVVKSGNAPIPSDLVRTEYVKFDNSFPRTFAEYLRSLDRQAAHYEQMADALERNPVLSMDYLRRAFLITGEERLRSKVQKLLTEPGLSSRAKNSLEQLIAQF